ncbi:SMI1/KNR4 family protein [Aureispira anguillae]|uniref:SMI1/KNR4 family protein n=1 Tax=Aureispira anguillae TaxID=2864201 RepID=A0A915VMS1_9BACT|nr:SMI1/KNR4 family protein [Aureispira anguillae]BDS09624.1 SMI1/KNR4 family protein [Aureispira anguillae]
MWTEVLTKLDQLKAYDSRHQVFGAKNHRYERNELLSAEKIRQAASNLGVELPIELVEFYKTIGNGIVGPCYGLLPIEKLRTYQADQVYPGAAYFKALAKKHKDGHVYPNGSWELDQDELKGLLVIIPEGSGHEICLATKGTRRGQVVYVSTNGMVHDSIFNLIDLYHNWLDRELEIFDFMLDLLDKQLKEEEIIQKVRTKYQVYNEKERLLGLITYRQD